MVQMGDDESMNEHSSRAKDWRNVFEVEVAGCGEGLDVHLKDRILFYQRPHLQPILCSSKHRYNQIKVDQL